jgi:hypothetical protein
MSKSVKENLDEKMDSEQRRMLEKLRQGEFPEWEKLKNYVSPLVKETIFEFFRRCSGKANVTLSYKFDYGSNGVTLDMLYELWAKLTSPTYEIPFIIDFKLDRYYEETKKYESYVYELLVRFWDSHYLMDRGLFRIKCYHTGKCEYKDYYDFIEKLYNIGRIPTIEQLEKLILKIQEFDKREKELREKPTFEKEKRDLEKRFKEECREIFGI